MKKLILLLFIFTSFVTLNAQPKIAIENNGDFDFGIVNPKDSPLRKIIWIYNIGDSTLVINKVKPGCRCTAAPLHNKHVRPGDSTFVNVEIDIEKLDGNQTKVIDVFSNDPKTNKKVIVFEAIVKGTLSFFPDKKVTMGVLSLSKESIGKIVISNNLDNDVTITGVELKPPAEVFTNAKKGTVIPAGGDIVLEVTVKPKNLGGFVGWVKLKTDDKFMQKVDIPVKGSVAK